MKNKNNRELSPCIVSWAKFALEIKLNQPKNSKKCTKAYWNEVLNAILSQSKFQLYRKNRSKALQKFYFVSKL